MQIEYGPFLQELKECGKEIINGTTFKRLEASTSADIFRTISKALMVAFTVGIVASVVVKSSILSAASCVLVVSHFVRQNDAENTVQVRDFFAEFKQFYRSFKDVFLV